MSFFNDAQWEDILVCLECGHYEALYPTREEVAENLTKIK